MLPAFQKHCSDERLIAHLDGELPFYRRARVQKHLAACWQCRLRLSEIERQVLETTRAMEEDPFPGPDRVAAAREQFLDRADQTAERVFRARRPRHTTAWRWLAPAAAGAAALAAFFVFRPAPQDAVAAMRRVEAVEAQAALAPAHQRLRVVARQLRPAPASHEGRLELWSEPGSGRYTTRFSDSRGVLRHALWQPAPGRQYVFNAGRSAAVLRLTRHEARERWNELLFRDGLTLEELEAGLFQWLEERPWRPVSLCSGVALLATEDGARLSVEEAGRFLRLSARKSVGGVTVEFSLDVDRRTYAPQLQRLRYESPARTLEIELSAESVAPTAQPVAFEPPLEVAALPPAPGVLGVSGPVAPAIAIDEISVLYALHSVHACLGEAIEVERRLDGGFTIRGVVVSPERKEEVSGALAALPAQRITVDLRSAQEALRDVGPGEATLAPAPAQVAARNLSRLAPYFSGSERLAEQFADRTLSQGESVMREAQALRHLAERFGTRERQWSPQARRLLESMERDHLAALETEVRAAQTSLRAVFAEELPPMDTPVVDAVPRSENLLAIFRLSQTLNDRLRRLFGAGTGQADERVIRELGEAFPPLLARIAAAKQ
jgi:anti-sigma-K factor RskA